MLAVGWFGCIVLRFGLFRVICDLISGFGFFCWFVGYCGLVVDLFGCCLLVWLVPLWFV